MYTSENISEYIQEVGYFLYNGWYGNGTDAMACTLGMLVSAHDLMCDLEKEVCFYLNQM